MKKSLVYIALGSLIFSCASKNENSQYKENFEKLLKSEKIQVQSIAEKKIFNLTERKKAEILCIENQQLLIDNMATYEEKVRLENKIGIYDYEGRETFQFQLQFLLEMCNECDSLAKLKDNKTEIGKLVWFNVEKSKNQIDSIGVPFLPNGQIDKKLFKYVLETYLK